MSVVVDRLTETVLLLPKDFWDAVFTLNGIWIPDGF